MKVAPTLDKRLRIDVESDVDRLVLQAIVVDARATGGGLADHLGGGMPRELAGDWEELVLPELGDGFDRQLEVVGRAVAALDGEGEIYITVNDAEFWYGALNQARLALEERHHLSEVDEELMPPPLRSAWYRSQFYLMVQGMLLDYLMG